MRNKLILSLLCLTFIFKLEAQPFTKILLDTVTPVLAHDSEFVFLTGDYNSDRIADLFLIKIANTGTEKTELHILDGASKFQKFILQTSIPILLTPEKYEFLVGNYNNDNSPDLYIIQKANTETNKMEVHVLDGATKYQTFVLQKPTPVSLSDSRYVYGAADFNKDNVDDIFLVQKENTGTDRTEVHILNGSYSFQNFCLQSSTALPLNPNKYKFIVANYDWDGTPDIVVLQKNDTSATSIIIDILDGSTRFQRYLTKNPVMVNLGDDADNIKLIGDFDRDFNGDLILIRNKKTTSGKIEIKVLCGRCKNKK